MNNVLCPGSYDPITLGHLSVIRRCAAVFDKVFVVVGYNENKKGLLTPEQRVLFAKDALGDLHNVEIEAYSGLTVDYAHEHDCDIIVKGIRNSVDLDYENEMAVANRDISITKFGKSIETLYIPSEPIYIYTSSSTVRQLMSMHLPIEKYVHNSELLYEILGI